MECGNYGNSVVYVWVYEDLFCVWVERVESDVLGDEGRCGNGGCGEFGGRSSDGVGFCFQ